jgi:hypothetical protein
MSSPAAPPAPRRNQEVIHPRKGARRRAPFVQADDPHIEPQRADITSLVSFAMAEDETLRRIAGFVRSIGIEVNEGAMTRETLVPGVDIVNGSLLIDEPKMCKPADLLHEAAHIALTLPDFRRTLDGTVNTSPAEEISSHRLDMGRIETSRDRSHRCVS